MIGKIYKEVKILSKEFKNYQLRVTPDIIEVKFTPENDNDDEAVFVSENNKLGIYDMYFNLRVFHKKLTETTV